MGWLTEDSHTLALVWRVRWIVMLLERKMLHIELMASCRKAWSMETGLRMQFPEMEHGA